MDILSLLTAVPLAAIFSSVFYLLWRAGPIMPPAIVLTVAAFALALGSWIYVGLIVWGLVT